MTTFLADWFAYLSTLLGYAVIVGVLVIIAIVVIDVGAMLYDYWRGPTD